MTAALAGSGAPAAAGSAPHRQVLRRLDEGDREQAHALSRLAFGGDPAAPAPPTRPGRRSWGVFDDGRLLAEASVLDLQQWWGGRPVPMGGVAGVAVHPDARGRGTGRRLVRHVLAALREAGQPVSVLFPTAPAIYRPLGWEVVASLDDTRLPVHLLREVPVPEDVSLRTAGVDDVRTVAALYDGAAAAGNGLLTRSGPGSPRPEEGVLEADVVALAEQDGVARGYVSYDRGRGYGPHGELRVGELCAETPGAARGLLGSLAAWDSVVETVRWRGGVDELALLLGRAVPPPVEARPWMLRIADAPAAVAARGFAPGLSLRSGFTLVDPEVPEQARAWTLVVEDGAGRLEEAAGADDAPWLHVRGLALLWCGAGSTLVHRAGLGERPLPLLDAAFAGRRPQLLDYF